MNRKRLLSGIFVLVYAVLFLMNCSASAANVPPATDPSKLPQAGENGYVSLHKYVSPTDIENVYRVEQTITGKVGKIPPIVDIVVLVDQSGSMRGPGFPNTPNSGRPMDDAVDGMLAMLDVFWDPALRDFEKEVFRIGIIGHQFTLTAPEVLNTTMDVSSFNSATNSVGGQVPYSAANDIALRSFLAQMYNLTIGGGENTPLALNYAFYTNPPLYFNASTSPSAPAGYKKADYQFVVVIADGAIGSSLPRLSGYRNTGDIDDVFVLGFSGNGFTHSLSVPDIPSDWNPSFPSFDPLYKTPTTSTTGNEQALLNISAIFPPGQFPINTTGLGNTGYNQPISNAVRSQVLDYNYYYVNNKAIAVQAFNDISDKIVSQAAPVGEDIVVKNGIAEEFELYYYPGKPKFEISSEDITQSWDPGIVSENKKIISWILPEIPSDGSELRLVYYIYIDPGKTIEDVYYKMDEYTYIEFKAVDSLGAVQNYVKYFDSPYVSPSKGVKEESIVDNNAVQLETSDTGNYTTEGLMPVFVSAYGEKPTVYTPSVTPSSQIVSETLQEGTGEAGSPNTGRNSNLLIGLLIVVFITAFAITQKKSEGKR